MYFPSGKDVCEINLRMPLCVRIELRALKQKRRQCKIQYLSNLLPMPSPLCLGKFVLHKLIKWFQVQAQEQVEVEVKVGLGGGIHANAARGSSTKRWEQADGIDGRQSHVPQHIHTYEYSTLTSFHREIAGRCQFLAIRSLCSKWRYWLRKDPPTNRESCSCKGIRDGENTRNEDCEEAVPHRL